MNFNKVSVNNNNMGRQGKTIIEQISQLQARTMTAPNLSVNDMVFSIETGHNTEKYCRYCSWSKWVKTKKNELDDIEWGVKIITKNAKGLGLT